MDHRSTKFFAHDALGFYGSSVLTIVESIRKDGFAIDRLIDLTSEVGLVKSGHRSCKMKTILYSFQQKYQKEIAKEI